MSHHPYLYIVFAGYLYRYCVRCMIADAYSMLIFRIQEYNHLLKNGWWDLIVESMKFIQNHTFPETAIQQRKLLKQTVIKTNSCIHHQIPLPIIDIIVDMAMPQPDTKLMKQIINEHNSNLGIKYWFALTLTERLFNLIDENNYEYKGAGKYDLR